MARKKAGKKLKTSKKLEATKALIVAPRGATSLPE